MIRSNIIIFGCGLGGERAIATLTKNETLIAFTDNDPTKHNSLFHKIPVIAPHTLRDSKFDLILVASQYSHSITEQLTQMGITSSKIEIITEDVLLATDHPCTLAHRLFFGTTAYLMNRSFALIAAWKKLSGNASEE